MPADGLRTDVQEVRYPLVVGELRALGHEIVIRLRLPQRGDRQTGRLEGPAVVLDRAMLDPEPEDLAVRAGDVEHVTRSFAVLAHEEGAVRIVGDEQPARDDGMQDRGADGAAPGRMTRASSATLASSSSTSMSTMKHTTRSATPSTR